MRELITIEKLPNELYYPDEFIHYCSANKINLPNIQSGNGKALAAMVMNPNNYFNRNTTEEFIKKYNIHSRDSIQLFNKHEQRGIKQSSEKGKYYIPIPYQLSNKYAMRKDFSYNGTEEQKNQEINKIKSNIQHDYIDVPNNQWQLGHKNPDSTDNTSVNLVLQPPIQSKYRDKYIFLDTLTKIPTPKTLKSLYYSNNCPYTREQLIEMKEFLNSLEITS
tara:strand:+ start:1142 stop:1801 length:660 start_codon:yes stop_codon:yes gene_type:complete